MFTGGSTKQQYSNSISKISLVARGRLEAVPVDEHAAVELLVWWAGAKAWTADCVAFNSSMSKLHVGLLFKTVYLLYISQWNLFLCYGSQLSVGCGLTLLSLL
jgi:hypothetical protein